MFSVSEHEKGEVGGGGGNRGKAAKEKEVGSVCVCVEGGELMGRERFKQAVPLQTPTLSLGGQHTASGAAALGSKA